MNYMLCLANEKWKIERLIEADSFNLYFKDSFYIGFLEQTKLQPTLHHWGEHLLFLSLVPTVNVP